ncbi:MAG: ABC transporter permease [Acetobacteraceae bacterium]
MTSVALRDAGAGPLRRALGATGAWAIALLRWPCFVAGLGLAVLGAAADPTSWRRPVRAEFRRTLTLAAGGAVPVTVAAALLVGAAMVFQALYWLGAAGQETLIGTVLTGVLVREIGPTVVGLLVAGRTGTATLIEVGGIRGSSHYRALEAQGIDPLLLLVMPRVLALAIATPALTILFVAIALVSGWGISFIGTGRSADLLSFLDDLLRAMGPGDFALLPIKAVLIGAVIGLVCCAAPLGAPHLGAMPARLVPRGFAFTLLALFFVSGLVSVIL